MEFIEHALGTAIAVVSLTLAGLSLLAWRREHSRRLLLVAVAYLLFAGRGLIVFVTNLISFLPRELSEHLSPLLVLAALVVFFIALVGE